MTRWLVFVVTYVTRTCRSRASLQFEVAALRHQLSTYKEEGRRPNIQPTDRLLWSLISRCWAQWKRALYLVQPRTVLEWQKKRFRDYWRELSCAGKPGRPRIPPEFRALIMRMWVANPTWGRPGLSWNSRNSASTSPSRLWKSTSLSVLDRVHPAGGRFSDCTQRISPPWISLSCQPPS